MGRLLWWSMNLVAVGVLCGARMGVLALRVWWTGRRAVRLHRRGSYLRAASAHYLSCDFAAEMGFLALTIRQQVGPDRAAGWQVRLERTQERYGQLAGRHFAGAEHCRQHFVMAMAMVDAPCGPTAKSQP